MKIARMVMIASALASALCAGPALATEFHPEAVEYIDYYDYGFTIYFCDGSSSYVHGSTGMTGRQYVQPGCWY